MLLSEEHSPGQLSMRVVRLIMRDRFWGCYNTPVLLSEEHLPGLLSMKAVRLIIRQVLGM